jgi:hypothetical protein
VCGLRGVVSAVVEVPKLPAIYGLKKGRVHGLADWSLGLGGPSQETSVKEGAIHDISIDI